MKVYEIPEVNVNTLIKKLNRAINKGASIKYEILDKVDKTFKVDEDVFIIECVQVGVEGSYKIDGWEFVATLEHTEKGNIIRKASTDDSIKIPDKYKTAKPECEYCHKIRNRKDTYIVYNEENNEFKQVGKECLKDLTQGLDANRCAEIASVFKLLDDYEDFDVDDFFNLNKDKVYISDDRAKKVAYALVKKFGYIKQNEPHSTYDSMVNYLYHDNEDGLNLILATDKELEDIDTWVDNLYVDNNDFLRNASLAWNVENVSTKHFNLIASLISYYFKDIKNRELYKKNSENSSYVGKVGDKITIDVKSIRVLYTMYNRYAYNGDDSYVYEIIDTNSNTFIWTTTKDLSDKEISKINATIKGYKEYKGIKQTVITRGSIIY